MDKTPEGPSGQEWEPSIYPGYPITETENGFMEPKYHGVLGVLIIIRERDWIPNDNGLYWN